MKKMYTSVLFVFFAFVLLYGQDTKEKQLSKTDEFSSRSGTLIEKQFIEVGKLKLIQFKVLKVRDIITGTSVSALRLEYEYKSSFGSTSDTKMASLDADEIDGLVKSIKALQSNIFSSSPKNYTEVTFRSRTGFEAGAYYTVDKNKWSGYLQLERFDRNSFVFFTTEDYTEMLALIEKAKGMM